MSQKEIVKSLDLLEKNYSKYSHLYYERKIKNTLTHSQSHASRFVDNLHNKNISFLNFIDHPITLRLVTSFLILCKFKSTRNSK